MAKARERRLKTDQIMISRLLARKREDEDVSLDELYVQDDGGNDLRGINEAVSESMVEME